jgi:hypothetical protein
MGIKSFLSWASVFVQLVAALLWYYATLAKVNAKRIAENNTVDGWQPEQIVSSDDGRDVLATAELQTYWNRWAAGVTGLGIAIMAVSTALPED